VVADARGHARVLQDFVAAITSGAAPLCDGREGRRSVALVEAMYRSARAGAPVVVAEREGVLDALER
jgi:predicted dehydrogenase